MIFFVCQSVSDKVYLCVTQQQLEFTSATKWLLKRTCLYVQTLFVEFKIIKRFWNSLFIRRNRMLDFRKKELKTDHLCRLPNTSVKHTKDVFILKLFIRLSLAQRNDQNNWLFFINSTWLKNIFKTEKIL